MARRINAVAASAAKVLATSATVIGSHSSAMRWKCNMTPTPAGTNSRERCCSRFCAVTRNWSETPPRKDSAANNKAMPITGPGIGKAKKSAIASPTSWNTSSRVRAPSMMLPPMKNGARVTPGRRFLDESPDRQLRQPELATTGNHSIASYSGRVRNSGYSGVKLILSKMTAA